MVLIDYCWIYTDSHKHYSHQLVIYRGSSFIWAHMYQALFLEIITQNYLREIWNVFMALIIHLTWYHQHIKSQTKRKSTQENTVLTSILTMAIWPFHVSQTCCFSSEMMRVWTYYLIMKTSLIFTTITRFILLIIVSSRPWRRHNFLRT